MIRNISIVAILAFSLMMVGNQVNAESGGAATYGDNANNNRNDNTDRRDRALTTAADINGVDFDWLGILGLAGLAGLAVRNRSNNPERQK